MSTKYRSGKDVPNSVLCSRLEELADAVTKGKQVIDREFVMRIPAELDHDADLVLYEASRRIEKLENKLAQLAVDAYEHI